MKNTKNIQRREFFFHIAEWGVGIFAAAAAIIGINPDFWMQKKRYSPAAYIGDAIAFFAGKYYGIFSSSGQNVIVLKTTNGIKAFDAQCTHAGCNVEWKENTRQFYCSCHQGLFSENGIPISGPPKKPLRELIVRERDNAFWIIASDKQ